MWNLLRSQENMMLLHNTQIVSPHRKSISTLNMDRTEGRFLLAGSSDATLSIYDLSPWGREPSHGAYQVGDYGHNVQNQGGPPTAMSVHKPVAQSSRGTSNEPGHSASIIRAEWYAFDTGAFVSASSDGALVVWDTEAMQPVAQWQPFPSSISSFHLSQSIGPSESLLVVASKDDAAIKLVDIRTGSASHTLTGHVRGVTAVQWCPAATRGDDTIHKTYTNIGDVVLASGSLDGTVRLWDIRKAGSRATICILDQEEASPFPLRAFQSDYRHLKKKKQGMKGPNSYQHVSAGGVSSHSGPVTGISFTSDGQSLVSCGSKRLQLWDLRSRGHLVTRHFAGSVQPPLLVVDHHAWMACGNMTIGAFSLEQGGPPYQILEGHLGKVTALESSFDSQQLMSGGADGMILMWGSQRRRKGSIVQTSPQRSQLHR
jgi:DNA excision repair protein ERCC-8